MFEESLPDLPADPLGLAQRLAGREYVSLFWGKNGSLAYLACDPVEHSGAFDPEPALSSAPGSSLHAVPRWVGLLPYEARRGLERAGHGGLRAAPHVALPHWLRYAAVAVIAADGVRVVGEDKAHASELSARLRQRAPSASAVSVAPRGAFEAPELHRLRIRRALEHIRAGDLYQVNLARRFDFQVRGAPWDVLARMLERGSSPFAAAFSWGALDVVSVSPELF